uniref:T9SS type A sorting domain-containing protein n=1 Tax=Flavobacterium sp. TaxID=239 RepID=UPI0026196A5F
NLKGGGITNTNGTITINNNSAITSNISLGAAAPTDGGGGIYIAAGTVNVTGGSIASNKAITAGGSGGGVFNFAGTFSANGTSITQNISNRAGGGIESAAGSTTNLTNVILNANNTGVIASGATAATPGNGGGFHITGAGNATIIGGTANDNLAAQEGGALWNGSGTMNVSNITVNNNLALGNLADDGGAGLFNNAGTLNISNAIVTNNRATGTLGSGGGIFGLNGSISVTNSSLDSNSANRAGGAIEVVNGTLTISNTNMTNNDVDGGAGTPAPGNGGALHITGVTTTTITGGVVTGNEARREGGGLWNQTGSTMTVTNVKIDANIARGNGVAFGGGGIFVNGGNTIVNSSSITNNVSTGAAGNGGGVHVKTGSATINTTTISGNTSASNGGGIFSNAGLTLNAVTIANNSAVVGGGIANTSSSLPALKNTIVASNTASTDSDVSSTTGAFVSNGFNLIGRASAAAFVASTGDIVGTNATPVNPLLASLANNGGTTLTHALLASSPAINKGNANDMFADQLGNPVFAGRRDIGAFESQNRGILLGSLPAATCGTTLSGWYSTITANFASGATNYRYRITKVDATDAPIGSPVVIERSVNNISLANVPGTTYNSTYRIEVSVFFDNMWQPYGPSCNVSTPNPVSTIGNQCGTTLTSFSQFVTANPVPVVTAYRFRVTRLNNQLQAVGLPQEYTSSSNKFNMNQLVGILYATTYSVEVALRNTDGTFLPYNVACNIVTPNHPTTQISANQCGNYSVPSNTTLIFADGVNGATQYRFRLFNANFDTTYTTSSNRFTLNNFPTLTPGMYSVQVAVKLPNEPEFGPYGATCSLRTPGFSGTVGKDANFARTTDAFTGFEVSSYPNPFNGSFQLNVKANADETIAIVVYDMVGKLVENRTLTLTDIENVTIGESYQAGIYNVIVSQGNNSKAIRVIKR